MTESEWTVSADPQAMLAWLVRQGQPGCNCGCRVSTRKLRLFAYACVRQFWRLLDAKSRRVVEMAELFAEGKATKDETFRLASDCRTIARCLMPCWDEGAEASAIIGLANMHNSEILPTYAALLRDVVGNPWRPVVLPLLRRCYRCGRIAPVKDRQAAMCKCGIWADDPPHCPWLTPTVLSLAEAAHQGQDSAGHLDPLRLAVLADALEEAGCDDEAILHHLRGMEPVLREVRRQTQATGPLLQRLVGWRPLRGPCVRGCAVLDALLGRS